jgi:hypothetical protein
VITSTTTLALIGDDAHAGLVVLWEAAFDNRARSWTVQGLIVEGELPPLPEIS